MGAATDKCVVCGQWEHCDDKDRCGRCQKRRKVPGPLVDERTHYVTICIFSDSEPVWRSPWLTLEDARALRERKAEEVRRAGWSHVVRMFYRDGSEVV